MLLYNFCDGLFCSKGSFQMSPEFLWIDASRCPLHTLADESGHHVLLPLSYLLCFRGMFFNKFCTECCVVESDGCFGLDGLLYQGRE